MAEALNHILQEGKFPDSWKESSLVLIPKAGEGKYRPICLINTMAKLLEYIIVERLHYELKAGEGISDRQYGFRKGRSTLDPLKRVIRTATLAKQGTWRTRKLCSLLTVDVRNAFNSAPWRGIMEALHNKGISAGLMRLVGNYLSGRSIRIEDGSEVETLEVTRGVPQGSVLGPTLWNCFYDGVLELKLPRGVTAFGYADDLALVGVSKAAPEMATLLSTSVNIVQGWMKEAGLEIAPEKTELVVFSGKRRITPVTLRVGGELIEAKRTLKYLGVTLDKNLAFREHLQVCKDKALRMTGALGRLMPNTKGPGTSKRRLLAAVAASPVLYAAGTWIDSLHIKANRALLVRAQRPAAIKVARCYRTTSTAAALVVGGVPPLHLQARYQTARGTRQERRKALLDEWQREWESGTVGAWTRRLIPDLRPWVSRRSGEVGHHLAQVLTGHGCFGSYLMKIGKRSSDRCRTCGTTEDAEHVLFACARWDHIRPELLQGLPNPGTMVSNMLQDTRCWEAVTGYIKEALRIIDSEGTHFTPG